MDRGPRTETPENIEPPGTETLLDRDSLDRDLPLRTSTAAGGTHPTGINSCSIDCAGQLGPLVGKIVFTEKTTTILGTRESNYEDAIEMNYSLLSTEGPMVL